MWSEKEQRECEERWEKRIEIMRRERPAARALLASLAARYIEEIHATQGLGDPIL